MARWLLSNSICTGATSPRPHPMHAVCKCISASTSPCQCRHTVKPDQGLCLSERHSTRWPYSVGSACHTTPMAPAPADGHHCRPHLRNPPHTFRFRPQQHSRNGGKPGFTSIDSQYRAAPTSAAQHSTAQHSTALSSQSTLHTSRHPLGKAGGCFPWDGDTADTPPRAAVISRSPLWPAGSHAHRWHGACGANAVSEMHAAVCRHQRDGEGARGVYGVPLRREPPRPRDAVAAVGHEEAHGGPAAGQPAQAALLGGARR